MRKAKKEIKDKAHVDEILANAHVGRLGTMGKDGYPMIKPLNFFHTGEHIYFHSATEGEKIEDILRDNRICFEVDVPLRYVKAKGDPCSAFYHYRSVILKGRAEIIKDAKEKRMALKALLEKYQPEGGYGDFPEEELAITSVIRIDIEAMTGKEDLTERWRRG
ncbi:MAG: pyridoxamine 5'-phosphate oxidase family protein [Syntrophales bacterium]|nr:pyridoxamine 5'-phosphate oxidase family protein [Syntrophales bacterium]